MSLTPDAPPIDLRKAMADPGATFAAPENVRDHPQLSNTQKVEILKQWEYDVAEADVAEEEGMSKGGSYSKEGSNNLRRRIILSLRAITGDDHPKTEAPTKHGSH